MNWREGLGALVGRRALSPEERERLGLKTIASCVTISHYGEEGVFVEVADLFGGLFGISIPGDRGGKIKLTTPALGSGFIVDDKHILTNNHVVELVNSAQMHFTAKKIGSVVQRQTIIGDVVARDVEHDLAVVRIRNGEMPFPPLRFQKSSVRIGQRVIAMKNPRVNSYMGSPAVVEDLGMYFSGASTGVTHKTMKLRAGSVESGDSGSPIVDERGMVVGIMRAVNSVDKTEGYAIPVDYALRLLKTARSL